MKEEKKSDYEKKRVRINISLSQKEQRKMKNKFHRILNGPEVKEIIMNDRITITNRNSDPQFPEVIRQLSKLGNNLNQLVRLANQKKNFRVSGLLTLYLEEIKKTIISLRKYR